MFMSLPPWTRTFRDLAIKILMVSLVVLGVIVPLNTSIARAATVTPGWVTIPSPPLNGGSASYQVAPNGSIIAYVTPFSGCSINYGEQCGPWIYAWTPGQSSWTEVANNQTDTLYTYGIAPDGTVFVDNYGSNYNYPDQDEIVKLAPGSTSPYVADPAIPANYNVGWFQISNDILMVGNEWRKRGGSWTSPNAITYPSGANTNGQLILDPTNDTLWYFVVDSGSTVMTIYRQTPIGSAWSSGTLASGYWNGYYTDFYGYYPVANGGRAAMGAADEIQAGGSSTPEGILYFNGSTWTNIGDDPAGNNFPAYMDSSGNLYTGGTNTIYEYSASTQSWITINGPTSNSGLSLLGVTSSGTIYADSSNDGLIEAVMPPATPTTPPSVSGVTQTTAHVGWSTDPGATGYNVYVNGSKWPDLSGYTTSGTDIWGLNPGTQYTATYTGYNSGGESGQSPGTTFLTIPATPSGLGVSGFGQTSTTVFWSGVTGASSYDVYLNGNLQQSGITGTSYTFTGLSPGTVYGFTVTAVNSSGASPQQSSAYGFQTIPATPSAPTASNITQSGVTLNWSSVTGASSYSVLENGTQIASGITSTSYQVTGLAAGTQYNFSLTATDQSGTSPQSSNLSVITVPAAPSTVSSSGTTQTATYINWTSEAGATGYYLYENGTKIQNVTSGTGVSIGGLTPGGSYKFSVASYNGSGVSPQSYAITVQTIPGTPTGLGYSGTTTTGTTLGWTAQNGASSYNIYQGGTKIGSSTSASFSVTGLSAGTQYTFGVSSVNATGESPQATVSLTTVPLAPGGLSSENTTATGTTILWDSTKGASSYNVYEGSTKIATGVTATSYNVTGLTASTSYTFYVTAVSNGGESAKSTALDVTTRIAPPTGVHITASTTTSLTVSWTASTGATSYNLYEDGSKVETGITGTSYDVTGLTPGSGYSFYVTAVNSAGESQPSASILATTLPTAPEGLYASKVSTTGAQLDWVGSAGATGYNLYVNGTLQKMNLSTTSYTMTGLTPGQNYTVYVTAVDAAGESAASSSVTFTTAPAAPTGLTASNVTPSEATISWTASSGATSYNVYVNNVKVQTGITTTSTTITGMSENTSYSITVTAVVNNMEGPASQPLTVKTLSVTPPAVSLLINNGATETTTDTVSLTVTATSNYYSASDLKMSFSQDGSTWTTPIAYTTSPQSFTLNTGGVSGEYTVYLQVTDPIGDATIAKAQIQYDTSTMVSTSGIGTLNGNTSTSGTGSNGGTDISDNPYTISGGTWGNIGNGSTSTTIGGTTYTMHYNNGVPASPIAINGEVIDWKGVPTIVSNINTVPVHADTTGTNATQYQLSNDNGQNPPAWQMIANNLISDSMSFPDNGLDNLGVRLSNGTTFTNWMETPCIIDTDKPTVTITPSSSGGGVSAGSSDTFTVSVTNDLGWIPMYYEYSTNGGTTTSWAILPTSGDIQVTIPNQGMNQIKFTIADLADNTQTQTVQVLGL